MAAEVRFTIDEQFMKSLQAKFSDGPRGTDIAKEALTVLNWAVDELSQGRLILSTDRSGGEVHRLVTPLLSTVRPKPLANVESRRAIST